MKKTKLLIVVFMLVLATILPISTSTIEKDSQNLCNEKQPLIGAMPCVLDTVLIEERTVAQKEAYLLKPVDRGWNWLIVYPNYAPCGMPDFSAIQQQWKSIWDGGNGIAESFALGDDVQVVPVGQPVDPYDLCVVAPGQNCDLESTVAGDDVIINTFCCAAVANYFWWLDSKYDNPDGFPGDGEDEFPLVEDYGAGDDHSQENAILLIEELAHAMNITQHGAASFEGLVDAVSEWTSDAGVDELFEINFDYLPTSFDYIAGEIEQGNSVMLRIFYCTYVGGDCVPVLNYFVTCAGVNREEQQIALCDPYWDIAHPGGPSHNDPQYVSYEICDVMIGSPCPNIPEIEWWLPGYSPPYTVVVYGSLVINTTNEPPDVPMISGETSGKITEEYDYTLNAVDSDNEDVMFYIDWGDGTQDSTAFVSSGTDMEVQHAWEIPGIFNVSVKAKDTNGYYSLPMVLEVEIQGFLPPAAPTITGPVEGKIKVAIEYNFTTIDPNGDDVYYFIEWGDSTNSSWIGPFSSGDLVTKSHTWSKKGTYIITATAKDIDGNESDSATLTVTMPYSYDQPFLSFLRSIFARFPKAFPLLRHLVG